MNPNTNTSMNPHRSSIRNLNFKWISKKSGIRQWRETWTYLKKNKNKIKLLWINSMKRKCILMVGLATSRPNLKNISESYSAWKSRKYKWKKLWKKLKVNATWGAKRLWLKRKIFRDRKIYHLQIYWNWEWIWDKSRPKTLNQRS